MKSYITLMRPFETVEPVELAKLERARRISDTRKLNAMLPDFIKKHFASYKVQPFSFTEGLPPKYPAWISPRSIEQRTNEHRTWVFGQMGAKPENVKDYVKTWNNVNNYV